MANGGKITFGVGFDVDPSGLNNLKQSFKELKQLTPTDLLKINPSFEGDMKKAKSAWGEIQSTVVRVDHAIDEAFNTDLGVLNINKLNASLERIGDHATNIAFSILSDDNEEVKAILENEQYNIAEYHKS